MAANDYRLKFHIMPPKGWLNDPNGLCFFKDEYHVFFQYSPDDANGGDKYWGHYISRDLVDFKFVGRPVAPDTEFDKNGAYSGSALVKDDTMYVYYTGNVKLSGEHDVDRAYSGREANTILIKSTDGRTFNKKKVVMDNNDYPKKYTCHVRDPKVWEEDGTYFMVQGGRIDGRMIDGKECKHDIRESKEKGHEADHGAVILFESKDLEKWNVLREIKIKDKDGNDMKFGYMWECPDYFKMEGLKEDMGILSLCPQGLEKQEYKYQNIYQSGHFVIEGDITDKNAILGFSDFTEWDMGFDFYAPQTFADRNGRRIMIGWAGMPDADYDNKPTADAGWQHALTVPRELKFYGGKVHQMPIEEIAMLHEHKEAALSEKKYEKKDYDKCFDMLINFNRADESGKRTFCFKISDTVSEASLELKYISGEISLEFVGKDAFCAGRGRNVRRLKIQKVNDIRILADTSLAEIYINSGEYVFTTRYYMGIKKNVSFESDEVFNIEMYDINRQSIEMDV